MGFVILMILGAYLLISAGVVAGAIIYAEKQGSSTIRWGASAALVMFLIPCWDWIPTVVAHKYYCEKEAGFWVYKTLDQWRAENPGVMETLTTQDIPQYKVEKANGYSISTTYWNARIHSTLKTQGKIFPNLWRREDEVVDIQKGEVLARYVGFSTSQEHRQAGWSGWKFWLDSEGCIDGQEKAVSFVKFVNQFKGAIK